MSPKAGPSKSRPQYLPALEMNSDGMMVNNSAHSAMNAHFAKVLDQQANQPKRANEDAHTRRRQDVVDRYVKDHGGPDTITTKSWSMKLPTVASPQPIYSGLYDQKSASANRQKQQEMFEGSFLEAGKVSYKRVYQEVDEAMQQAEARKKSLGLVEKATWSQEKKTNFFYAPLNEAVAYLNETFAAKQKPLRIHWREIQLKPGHKRVDLFFVYPNSQVQYDEGFHTWMGAKDVTTL